MVSKAVCVWLMTVVTSAAAAEPPAALRHEHAPSDGESADWPDRYELVAPDTVALQGDPVHLTLTDPADDGTTNNRPIIGVLSQELSQGEHDLFPGGDNFSSYIPGSYVKFLDGVGARAVPIIESADWPNRYELVAPDTGDLQGDLVHLTLTDPADNGTTNNRPIIGVLSQELSQGEHDLFPGGDNFSSYIPGSYVKFLEGAGARAVPIMIDQPTEYYEQLYLALNGLVFPGGSADLADSGYGRAARVLWDLAAAHPEDYFPVLGICLGFELITYLELERQVLRDCEAENEPSVLDFSPDGEQSRMFSGASEQLKRVFATENVTINFHKYCFSPDDFNSTGLHDNYTLISTSLDWQLTPFVSALEHVSRPIYGTQFHPEKPLYEWGTSESISNIPHWADAVAAAQYLADFFVGEARKSSHRFSSLELEQKSSIYNYQAMFTNPLGSDFTTTYFFF